MSVKQAVILVYSTSHAICIEKLLKDLGVTCRLIPVPRHLSSDCGVCVRIDLKDIDVARKAVKETQIEIDGCYEL